jgi:hypothetical protein
LQESGPVGAGAVAGGVLAESDVTVRQRGFGGREIGGGERFFSQESVDRTGSDGSDEHAFSVDPAAFDLLRARADEDGARSAEGD